MSINVETVPKIKEFNYVNNKFNISRIPIPEDIYEYFYYFPKPYEELFGKDIITTFYSTKYLFKKLEDFYEMMLNLIEINKDKLNKKVSRNNYTFNQSNFIFFDLLTKNYNDDFNNLFNLSMQSFSSKISASINKDEKDFLSKFEEIDGVFNCLSNNKSPFFLNLFNANYNGKDKDFFMDLFKEYSSIRQQILSIANIKGNAGILSLEPFIQNDIKSNLNNNVKQNVNNNKNNIENSLFFNSNKSIYNGINTKNNINNSSSSISSLTSSTVNQPIIDSTNYSLFYKKNLSNANEDFSTKIHEIFKELHENLCDIVFFDRERPLHEILLISIKIDYLSLKFFYNFIESVKFKNITDTSIKINSYIYGNIELYNQYLPSFLSWRDTYVSPNTFLSSKKKNSIKIDEEGLIFDETLKQFFTDWDNKIMGIKKKYKDINQKKKKIQDFTKGIKLVKKSLKKK